MNFNLYLPFPIPSYPGESSANDLKKKKDKGKAKAFANANPNAPATTVDRGAGGSGSLASANGFEGEGRGKYWTGLERDEREKMGRVFGLAGHCRWFLHSFSLTQLPFMAAPSSIFTLFSLSPSPSPSLYSHLSLRLLL